MKIKNIIFYLKYLKESLSLLIQSIENENYRIFEMKDLVTSEKYELEDFLKILKSGKSLNLTVRLKDRVIQGFNDLNSSFSPINSVIGDKF